MPREISVHYIGMPWCHGHTVQLLAFSPPSPSNSPSCLLSYHVSHLHLPLGCDIHVVPDPFWCTADEGSFPTRWMLLWNCIQNSVSVRTIHYIDRVWHRSWFVCLTGTQHVWSKYHLDNEGKIDNVDGQHWTLMPSNSWVWVHLLHVGQKFRFFDCMVLGRLTTILE